MQTYKDHLPVLDTLLGLAAVLVMFTHVPPAVMSPQVRVFRGAVQPGWIAIEVFFVLSGFLITRILLADRARGKPLRHFLVRRFLRIFPIYYLFLGVMLLWHPWSEMGWNFLYLSNFHYPFHDEASHLRHTWSLSVEEHYYTIWALVVYLLPLAFARHLARYGFLLLALVSAVVTLHLMDSQTEAKRLLYMGSMYRAGSLALGSALAFSEHSIRTHPRRWLAGATGLFLVGMSLVQVYLSPLAVQLGIPADTLRQLRAGPSGLAAGRLDLVVRVVAYTMISGSIVLGCVCLHGVRGLLGRVLRFSPLQFIGKISYGWYLFHVPIFGAVLYRWGPTLSSVGIAVAAAVVSYYSIERPILRLKQRFA